MVNTNEEIGRMVNEFAEVKRRLAAVTACIKRKGEKLEALGGTCVNMPGSAKVREDHFEIWQNTVPFVTLDELREDIGEYEKARQRKMELESCLKEAGLQDLISN